MKLPTTDNAGTNSQLTYLGTLLCIQLETSLLKMMWENARMNNKQIKENCATHFHISTFPISILIPVFIRL